MENILAGKLLVALKYDAIINEYRQFISTAEEILQPAKRFV